MSQNLEPEQIKVLTALAEIVIGADAFDKVPDLIDRMDVCVTDLSSGAKDELDRGLNYLGSDLFMGFLGIVTGVDVEFESFDELNRDERRRFLAALKRSHDADMRALYVSLTGLVTTAFYGTFPETKRTRDSRCRLDPHVSPENNLSRVLPWDPSAE